MQIVAADIGGTHARFAIAELNDGEAISLSQPVLIKTADHPSLEDAWCKFADIHGHELPKAAAIALACPISGETLRLSNCDWTIVPAGLDARLGLCRLTLLNDFAAVAHAVADLPPSHIEPLHGPKVRNGPAQVTSILGLGTGLGVAQLLRYRDHYHIAGSEGGHAGFAPVDRIDEAIFEHLHERYGRVSVERIVSGPGLRNFCEALTRGVGDIPEFPDDRDLWESAIARSDNLATRALERLCLCLGTFAGDMALTHGADAVVIAGGLAIRIRKFLEQGGFRARFLAKGRFANHMAAIPVGLMTHPQPGLFGAAAAFVKEHAI